MHALSRCLFATIVGLLLVAAPLAGAEQEIYVTRDASGQPVFSDRPRDDSSERVELRRSNIYEAGRQPRLEPRPDRRRSSDDAARIDYRVRITSPADEEGLRVPEGRFQVQVEVEPGLASGHRLELLRNGEPVNGGNGGSFEVQTYDRGESVLVARIMDGDRELARSEAVTVYLLRRGLLSPAPANPAPNFRPPGNS